MEWIEPLELETWFVNILAGSSEIFTAVALFMILSMAGFFRMNGLTVGLMVFMFLLMFSGFLSSTLLIFIAIIGGTIVGMAIGRLIE